MLSRLTLRKKKKREKPGVCLHAQKIVISEWLNKYGKEVVEKNLIICKLLEKLALVRWNGKTVYGKSKQEKPKLNKIIGNKNPLI